MKDGALLVNVARGPVVDTAALVAALHVGPDPRRASTSSTPSRCPPTARCGTAPGLLVSPHVGGSSSAMWPRAHRLVRDQLHRIAAARSL